MAEPNVNLTPLGIRLGALSPPCASLKMENGEDNGREVVTLHLSVSSRYELVSHSLSIQPSFASKPVHSLHPCFWTPPPHLANSSLSSGLTCALCPLGSFPDRVEPNSGAPDCASVASYSCSVIGIYPQCHYLIAFHAGWGDPISLIPSIIFCTLPNICWIKGWKKVECSNLF